MHEGRDLKSEKDMTLSGIAIPFSSTSAK